MAAELTELTSNENGSWLAASVQLSALFLLCKLIKLI